jgi:hypothetical protein
MKFYNRLKNSQLKAELSTIHRTDSFKIPLWEIYLAAIPVFGDVWLYVSTWVLRRKIARVLGALNL